MDAGYQSINNFGNQKTNQVGQNGARTTTFKFNGTEDLGGGMNANFQFEVQPSIIAANGNGYNATYPAVANSASAYGANGAQSTGAASPQSGLVGKGQSFIGLTDAKLGSVQFGTINTAAFGAWAAGSALGTGIGSGYGSGNTFGDITRVESSVAYKSPSFNGIDFSALYGVPNDNQWGTISTSTNSGAVLRRAKVVDLGVNYANGPLTVKFGRLQSTTSPNENSTASDYTNNLRTQTQLIGASYDLGVAKLGAVLGGQKTNASDATKVVDNKWQILAVTVPFGANRVIAQAGTVKAEGANTASYNKGLTSKSTGIAFERDLSKRTFVYVRYEKTNLEAFSAKGYLVNGAAANGTTVSWGSVDPIRTVTTVGVSHSF